MILKDTYIIINYLCIELYKFITCYVYDDENMRLDCFNNEFSIVEMVSKIYTHILKSLNKA